MIFINYKIIFKLYSFGNVDQLRLMIYINKIILIMKIQ